MSFLPDFTCQGMRWEGRYTRSFLYHLHAVSARSKTKSTQGGEFYPYIQQGKIIMWTFLRKWEQTFKNNSWRINFWNGEVRTSVIVLPQKTMKILAKALKLFQNSGNYPKLQNKLEIFYQRATANLSSTAGSVML